METRANYLLVGLFVILFALGFLGFVIWLAKVQIDTTFAYYDIVYRGSVTGLKEGSPVRFSGVRVGQAVTVRLDPADPSQVRITIEVDRLTPVRSDTEASLEFEGLTEGVSPITAVSVDLSDVSGTWYPDVVLDPTTITVGSPPSHVPGAEVLLDAGLAPAV